MMSFSRWMAKQTATSDNEILFSEKKRATEPWKDMEET